MIHVLDKVLYSFCYMLLTIRSFHRIHTTVVRCGAGCTCTVWSLVKVGGTTARRGVPSLDDSVTEGESRYCEG